MYDEYTIPKVKVHITARNVFNFFMWLIAIVVGMALIAGLVVGLMSADTSNIDNKLNNDCLMITYKENHAFKPDRDLSGTYCKEQS